MTRRRLIWYVLGLLVLVAVGFTATWLASPSAHGAGVQIVSSGSSADHTCALLFGGEVRCWGENEHGQIGDGTTVDRLTPVGVALDAAAIGVAVGGHHTCAALVDGSVWCWGRNNDGQLGDGQACGITCPPVRAQGIEDAVGVAAGTAHSCAVLVGETIACWGNNDHGQIGRGTVGQDETVPEAVSVQGAALDVAAGDWHTCALLSGGGAKCWGENIAGQLGNGLSNVNATLAQQTVVGLAGATKLALGALHSCALVGTAAECWGEGYELTPSDVTLSGPAGDLAAGGRHTCAVVQGWTECWGANAGGQLGQPTPAERAGAGREHSCATTPSGFATCWGANASGQLGDGTTSASAMPVNVAELSPGEKVPLTPTPTPTATPPPPDSDGDGCLDKIELGSDAALGGLRDPTNPWDFYDVNGDLRVDVVNDILPVILAFDLQSGEPGYSAALDRGPPAGSYPWSRSGPDGSIDVPNDILAVVYQFRHDCG